MTGNSLKLIVGLGNPGSQYDSNRHNAGVIFLHHLAKSYSGSLRGESKFFGEFGSINIAGDDIKLLFPTTFMNNSGKSVAAACKFYKIEPENMLSRLRRDRFRRGRHTFQTRRWPRRSQRHPRHHQRTR